MISSFDLGRTPRIVFGCGCFEALAGTARTFGKTILVITGKSATRSGLWDNLAARLADESLSYYQRVLSGEPTPDFIDETTEEYRDKAIDVVVALGGGSVLDAGKAVSAMLTRDSSVMEYLEGIGCLTHDGKKVPFIAVPTTAGTGSEATKNAVLRRIGPDGFKRSIRHDNFMPDVAVVDPLLTISCPGGVSAACGMDALTQLIESYVSRRANPFTDALAESGMAHIKEGLLRACITDPADPAARADMSYASLVSGITLAGAGLGVVHGAASVLGGFFDIPHGVVCGTLLSSAVKKSIDLLRERVPEGEAALAKYARTGAILSGRWDLTDMFDLCDILVETISSWTENLSMPRLSAYGITRADMDRIVDGTGNKENPIAFDRETIRQVLLDRL